ncbi:hypothetical protein [Bradyrhizobium sp. SZCCHNR1015]|uniref:hypothetical protein n=1 Tax=Bradyrhizobium sp. SZCCHNR1015 TaxID=3057338 RepID=UPI0029164506|nr:hypothetical protein [Bradyrhizobium sp. SZCCHNR1015]
MSTFEERLAAANDRAKSRAETAEMQRAKEASDRAGRAQLLNTAISDWNDRLAPCIMAAVSTANSTLTDSGIALVATPSARHVFGSGPGALNVSLPAISITAGGRNPAIRDGYQVQVGQPSSGRSPHAIVISLNESGFVVFDSPVIRIPTNGQSRVRPPMQATDVSRDLVETVLADFIDDLIP